MCFSILMSCRAGARPGHPISRHQSYFNNSQITGANFMVPVGLDWQVGGFGKFSSCGTSDMILCNTTTGGIGGLRHRQQSNHWRAAFLGTVGLHGSSRASRPRRLVVKLMTRVGRILRCTNIDELPQLVNVLLGEMSIVGPRPHPIALNEAFAERLSPLSRRHKVKPGITGWAQVHGHRGETDTLEKMRRRIECDLYYIDNWSFLLDIKIIVMTLFSRRAYTNAV